MTNLPVSLCQIVIDIIPIMILTQNLINKLSILQQLDQQNYQKAVVFALNSLQGQSQVYLHDVLGLDQDKAEQILSVLLKFILYCSKFKTSPYEMDVWLQSTNLSQTKTKIFKQRLIGYLDKVRNKLHHPRKQIHENQLKDLNWRFQITVASKTRPSEFRPEVILDFITSDAPHHNFVGCDFANLKNLHEELSAAYKQHDSSANKKVRNSIV